MPRPKPLKSTRPRVDFTKTKLSFKQAEQLERALINAEKLNRQSRERDENTKK